MQANNSAEYRFTVFSQVIKYCQLVAAHLAALTRGGLRKL